MRALGAVIHVVPGGYPEAESAGKAYAEKQGKTWVSPYNDGQVIAGQGTVGKELSKAPTPRSAARKACVSGSEPGRGPGG